MADNDDNDDRCQSSDYQVNVNSAVATTRNDSTSQWTFYLVPLSCWGRWSFTFYQSLLQHLPPPFQRFCLKFIMRNLCIVHRALMCVNWGCHNFTLCVKRLSLW